MPAQLDSSLAALLPVGVFTTDAQGHSLFTNACYRQLCGLNAAAEQGDWRQWVHPEDCPQVDQRWAALRTSQQPFVAEYRLQRPDGALVWVHTAMQLLDPAAGASAGYVAACTDVSARKAVEQEVQHMAFYDSLTGLPNRRLFHDRLQQAVASNSRKRGHGALLFMDLDYFKTLNDTHGHDMGDLLLQQVGQRLKASVREGDSVARLGGDEFVAILENLSPQPDLAARQAELVAEKILQRLNQPYVLRALEHHSTPSIGITLFDTSGQSVDELMKRADMAMYQAKAAGRNTLRFFDPAMQAVVQARQELEADLRAGLQLHQFSLHYQPQVRSDGSIYGAEAFVRWLHPQRGSISPATFIPLAEETGLIAPLGHWVLRSACEQLALWAKQPHTAALTMAVKVSAPQFRQPDFVDEVLHVLHRTGARPERLKLEINENLLLADVEDIITKTQALSTKGIGFALADLGTGYSSLSHLKRLSLEQLRIDQTFVRGLLTNANDASVTKSIFALAESLDLKVSAEGVETQAQHDALAHAGCYAYQGYLFSQPLKLADFEALLKR